MRKYDTIRFDMDGTLLNSLEDILDGINFQYFYEDGVNHTKHIHFYEKDNPAL